MSFVGDAAASAERAAIREHRVRPQDDGRRRRAEVQCHAIALGSEHAGICPRYFEVIGLPRSNAVLFGIRCYLISVRELATIPKWARRVHRVLRDLHPALVDYKGLTRYRDAVVAWLAPFDDGAPTSPGNAPD